MANLQIFPNPASYINGLTLTYVSTTKVGVDVGAARDLNNVTDIILDVSIECDITVNGVNGLDTGTVANSTWYYVYIIGDSTLENSAKSLMSASSTPLLPNGYDVWRRIGWVKTDGAAGLISFTQSGNGDMKYYQFSTEISVLTGGSSITFADVDLSAGTPPIFTLVTLLNETVPNTAGNPQSFVGYGVTGGGFVVTSAVAAIPNKQVVTIISGDKAGAPNIQYKTAEATDAVDLFVIGFWDNL